MNIIKNKLCNKINDDWLNASWFYLTHYLYIIFHLSHLNIISHVNLWLIIYFVTWKFVVKILLRLTNNSSSVIG
jgi:hypothetical protein